MILTKLINEQKHFLRARFPFIYRLILLAKGQLVDTRRAAQYKHVYGDILSIERGNDLVASLVKEAKPLMISRFGGNEAECVYGYLKGKYSETTFEAMSNQAGFFPADVKYLDRFCQLFLDSTKSVDALAVWFRLGEPEIIQNSCPNVPFMGFNGLEPYCHAHPWSKNLEGKKVLVIHPFTETIASQYANHREVLFENKDVLPQFELKTLKAVQSIAGTKTEFDTWFDAYDWMCHQIKNIDFDVAIIGCGAYGLPLSACVKSLGKQAIHLGGATQILFGIKGKRYDDIPFYRGLYNQYWVRPSSGEKIQNYLKVETGCYW